MEPQHVIHDYKPIDPAALGDPDDLAEEVQNVSKKVRRAIEEYLGSERVIDIPISAPRYYCGLVAHALERQREEGGWKAEQVLGPGGSQARYISVSVAPGKEEALLQAGIVLLRRRNVRLTLNVDLDPMDKADVVVSVAAEQRRHGEKFAAELAQRLAEKKLYRGAKLAFEGSLTFLELASLSWDDISVPAETRHAIVAHTTRFLEWAPRLEPHGVSPRRGLLLTGKPGTGKTLVCKVLMNTSPGVTCLVAHTAYMMHPLYIDELYKLAADLSPTIVFLEDIDLIGQGRLRSGYGMADALSRLLFALDGVQDCRNVVTVATTNWLEILDEALKDRPSRFDRVISIEPPDAQQRRSYLNYLARKVPLPPDVIDRLVQSTAGMTPAQIQEVVHCAIIECVVPPDSPDYWETVFSSLAVGASRAKGGNGAIGFVPPLVSATAARGDRG